MALISLLLTGIYLLIMLCGFGLFCCDSDNRCSDRIWGLCALIVAIVWILAASLLNILIIIKGWPFCFDKDLAQSIEGN